MWFQEKDPRKRSRHSELTWITARDTPVVTALQQRLAAVTGLPMAVLSNSGTMREYISKPHHT